MGRALMMLSHSFFVNTQIILEEMIALESNERASKANLFQAVAQRWISIAKMLLRVLESWSVLQKFYLEKKKEHFPLKGKKDEVGFKRKQHWSLQTDLRFARCLCSIRSDNLSEGHRRILPCISCRSSPTSRNLECGDQQRRTYVYLHDSVSTANTNLSYAAERTLRVLPILELPVCFVSPRRQVDVRYASCFLTAAVWHFAAPFPSLRLVVVGFLQL